jgi:hypothetical protein
VQSFEGISPGHFKLVELERMPQRTVGAQPPRPDGAATGWLQGVLCRPLAGGRSQEGFGLSVPREHLVAGGAKWATKLVEGICPPVLHLPCHPPQTPPPSL